MIIVHFMVFLCRQIFYTIVVEWSEPSSANLNQVNGIFDIVTLVKFT